MWNQDTQINFKTSIIKSILCYYNGAYILVKRTISIKRKSWDNPNNGDKEVVCKNCTPFTDCISEINNTQIDNAKDTDVVMPMIIIQKH